MAVDLGRRKIPTMRGLESLVGKIFARARGKKLGGSDIASRIDVELDRHADGAADGCASFPGHIGHDFIEHFALRDDASGRLCGNVGANRSRCRRGFDRRSG